MFVIFLHISSVPVNHAEGSHIICVFVQNHHLPVFILVFFGGKKKFDRENSYKTFCGENVPEQPLRTHRDKPSSIISASSVMTMGIFP
jgi:hypothetical protein